MILSAFAIAAVSVAVMLMLSRRAGTRLKAFETLPMQWGFDGKPTWHAPRRIALGFAPMLGGLTLGGTAAIPLVAPGPMSGDGATVFSSVMLVSALVWVAVHMGHLWMLDRWAKAQG